MTATSTFDSDGRIRGAYIYLLLCRDGDGPVYVKVGMTSNPTRRLHQLRLGCPVTPHQFCTMRQPSEKKARRAETALHRALGRWRSSGEWYRVPISEKAEFNATMQETLRAHRKTGFPTAWEKIAVQPLVKLAAENLKAAQRAWASGSQARRDFFADSKRGLHSA